MIVLQANFLCLLGPTIWLLPSFSSQKVSGREVATLDGQRLALATYLRQQPDQVSDLSIRLGSIPALWLVARLLVVPVAPEIAEQRRAHLLAKAKEQGHVRKPKRSRWLTGI